MQSSTEPVMQPEWQQVPEPEPPSDSTRWLYRAQKFSLVRTHISVFAIGSIALFSINLLSGASHVWASTWVSAWALLVIVHAIVAGIATLAIQLLSDDDDIRPASEVSWTPVAAWGPPPSTPEPEATSADPGQDADPWHTPPSPSDANDRVSWRAASDAAWLTKADDHGEGELTPAETADDAEPSPPDHTTS